MSEKLCTLKKKGGGTLKETTLWTNPSPSSAFAAQTVTLSQDFTTFDYVRIYWMQGSANTTDVFYIDIPSDVMVESFIQSGNPKPFISLCAWRDDTNYSMARRVFYSSNTKIQFTTAILMNGTGTNNALIIPTKISGIK